MKEFYIMIALIAISCFFLYIEHVKHANWHKKPLRNFPFYYKGKLFWYSRSVATTLFAFCKDESGELCVLANLRGKGAPDFQNHWNVPCGYLDYHETGEQAAQREAYEETGINIPIEQIKLIETDTRPSLNRQNISLRYATQLDGVTTDYTFSKKNMEKDEVDAIKWIKVSELERYKWAFNHSEDIERMITLCKLK